MLLFEIVYHLAMTEPRIKRTKESNAIDTESGFNSDDNIIVDLEEPSSQKFPRYGSHSLDHYFTEELSEKITSKRFRIAVYRKQIRLRNIEDAPSTPDELLKKLIEYLIEEARTDKHKQFGGKPDSFSFVFRSPILTKPIHVCLFILLLV